MACSTPPVDLKLVRKQRMSNVRKMIKELGYAGILMYD
jgi:hypothetical protein